MPRQGGPAQTLGDSEVRDLHALRGVRALALRVFWGLEFRGLGFWV